MVKSRLRPPIAAVLAGALLAAGITASAAAQPATPNLEGVWKIAAPTNTLKPVGGDPPFTAEGRKQYDENKRLQAKGADAGLLPNRKTELG